MSDGSIRLLIMREHDLPAGTINFHPDRVEIKWKHDGHTYYSSTFKINFNYYNECKLLSEYIRAYLDAQVTDS